VESPEKQKQLSRPFHRPLEISLRRDSHIPTARLRPGWESAKPKTGFSLSHTWLATMTTVRSFKKQTTKKGSRPLRGLVILNFQDHLVLETETAFRIILRLENAGQGRLLCQRAGRFHKARPNQCHRISRGDFACRAASSGLDVTERF